jgi:hypothetical protein
MTRRLLSLTLVAVFAACEGRPDPVPPVPVKPTPADLVVGRTSLDEATHHQAGSFTGLAVDASGERLALDATHGIYRVTDGSLRLSFESRTFASRFPTGVVPLFEDMAVIDANRVVLIAKNDGYVFEVGSEKLLNRFCYLPGDIQDQYPDAWQLSRSVGYDPADQKIYAQPQTFSSAGTVIRSELGQFSPELSNPLEWQRLGDTAYNAGGMAVASRSVIYLGQGAILNLYDASTQRFVKSWNLAERGIASIDGLALDNANHSLLVLDGVHRELVELRLSALQ